MSSDRPINDPGRHFMKLAASRRLLDELASRYPSKGPEYQALADAAQALDRAAIFFTQNRLWFTGMSRWGASIQHTGCIPLPD